MTHSFSSKSAKLSLTTLTLFGYTIAMEIQKPDPQPKPTQTTFHGGKFTLEDPFSWLRPPLWENATDGTDDPEILGYLAQEEAYLCNFYQGLQPTIDSYVQTRRKMMVDVDDSYPRVEKNYAYFRRVDTKLQYPVHYRFLKDQSKETATIYFDANKEAGDHKFYSTGSLDVSPCGEWLAYAFDTEGHEKYTLGIRNLLTGQVLPEVITNLNPSVIWKPDSSGFFYERRDAQDRTRDVCFHILGQAHADDRVIYTDKDLTASMGIYASAQENYLFITSGTKDENEVWGFDLLSSDHSPTLLFEKIAKRKVGVDCRDGVFYLRVNDTGTNFRLATVPMSNLHEPWEEILPHDPERYLLGLSLYAKGLVLSSRLNGVTQINVLDEKSKGLKPMPLPDLYNDVSLMETAYDSDYLRFAYSTLIKPPSVMESDFENQTLHVRKTKVIENGYDPENYVTDRLFMEVRDGVKVPVSIVYRKDRFSQDGSMPLFLYGYGSYGSSIPVGFRERIIPYLDQGFSYAIAHVRGGSEMGYPWYLDGKMENKWHTFHDYIDVAKALIDQKYTSLRQITAHGASAGGLLMGVVANEAPELFNSVIMQVPFVDLMNTMLDSDLPLTPNEFKEWGNPAEDPQVFASLLSYSPYDNMAKGKDYPPTLVTGGLYDFRVTFWEPAKYVAKMRYLNPDVKIWLDIKTTGHAGGTGLDSQLKEDAEVFSFTLKMQGMIKS